jgi:hypothetical protein
MNAVMQKVHVLQFGIFSPAERVTAAKVARKACSRRSEHWKPKPHQTFATNVDTTLDTIAATQTWFESVVIGEKLCPFAPPLLQNDGQALRIVASKSTNEEQAVKEVEAEANLLIGTDSSTPQSPRPETTLLVMNAPFVQDFRDFVRLSWTLQENAILQNNLVEKLQLVLFHPLATHQTYAATEEANPGDYTIRSPYPTIHLLRQDDVMRAVSGGYPDLQSLPARNQARLISQGLETCKSRLEQCYRHDYNDNIS